MSLPSGIPGLAGPVLVRWKPVSSGGDVGLWDPEQRTATLSAKASRAVQEQTLWHEWVHSVLDDAGVKLPPKQEEAVCDAMALGMLCLRRAKWISFRRLQVTD